MGRVCVGLLAAVVGLAAPAAAADVKDAVPPGTWVREFDGVELSLRFQPDALKINVAVGENGVLVTAKYTRDKDGVIKATVTDSEEKGTFPGKPPKGMEFQFKFAVTGKTAELSDYKGGMADEGKKVIEGEYKAKDGK